MKKITQALAGRWHRALRLSKSFHPDPFFRRALVTAGLAALACAGLPAHAGSVSYRYDALGRLAAAVYSNGASSTTITYSYDPAGNRTAVATTTP